MKNLEIWKIVKLDFNSTGLLVSSCGGIKNSNFIDRKVAAERHSMPRTTLSSILNKRSRVWLTDMLDEEFKLNKGVTK